jgi:proteasome lid subunit RPN8/RPN11
VTANVQISLYALAEMIKYDLSHQGKETAGLLIGKEIEGIVHIDEMRVGSQKGNAVHVVISDEELTNAAVEVSNREDGRVIVGWWHTHPGLSAFLSSTDIKTQGLYQAFMSNAVAIVIDDVEYSKTHKLTDLDLGVFRIENGQTVRIAYSIKDSVELGLNSYLKYGYTVTEAVKKPTSVMIPVLDLEELDRLRFRIKKLEDQMDPSDIAAVNAWVELAESLQNGSITDVPIDVGNLTTSLSDSLERIDDTLLNIEDILLNKQAQRGLVGIILGILVELSIFYILLA